MRRNAYNMNKKQTKYVVLSLFLVQNDNDKGLLYACYKVDRSLIQISPVARSPRDSLSRHPRAPAA